MTPVLPHWIRDHRIDGYFNVYQMVPDETRLYGTESLYGDWSGHILLLAKDFACHALLLDRIARGQRAYSHDSKLRTNRRLQTLAKPLLECDDSQSCGVLYGSALASLCRADGRMSGSLPNKQKAMEFGSRVLRFTIDSMPRLKLIVCLGDEAWACAQGTLGLRQRWAAARDALCAEHADGIAVVAAYHPAARVTNEVMERPWSLVYRLCNEA